MIITFSGIDGSGKTTQSRYVADLLQSWGYTVRYLHIISWTLVNRMGRLAGADHETTFLQNGQTGGRRKLYAGARLAISLIDILRFRALVGYQCIFGRRVLVCDRFFYDLGVQAIYTNVMSSALESLYWNLVPSPTLSILLDVPPEIAQRREGEHELAYYHSKRKLYLERAPRWNSIIIDAIELAETKQEVLHILHNRLELNLD